MHPRWDVDGWRNRAVAVRLKIIPRQEEASCDPRILLMRPVGQTDSSMTGNRPAGIPIAAFPGTVSRYLPCRVVYTSLPIIRIDDCIVYVTT